MPSSSEEVPADQRQAMQLLVDALATVWGKKSSLAAAIGVVPSTITHWISGARSPSWAVVLRAARRTLQFHPTAGPEMVQAFARHLLGLHGRWVPEDDDLDGGDWSDESADLVVVLGQAHQAVRDRDSGAVDRLAVRAQRELDQAFRAARREVA